MNKIPSVSETIALLERLKEGLRDFSAREQKLEEDFRARSAAEERSSNSGLQAQKALLQHELSDAESTFQQAKTSLEARFASRKNRINEAHKLLRRKAVEDVSLQEGRRKHQLQQKAMGAERHRDAELAQAKTNFQTFEENLAVSETNFAALEARAHRVFRGYHQFRVLLKAPSANASGAGKDEYALFEELQNSRQNIEGMLQKFVKSPLTLLVRFTPPAWLLALLLATSAGVIWYAKRENSIGLLKPANLCVLVFGGLLLLRLLVYWAGVGGAGKLARQIALGIVQARTLHELCHAKSSERYEQEQIRIKSEFESSNALFDGEYKQAMKEAITLRDLRPRQLDEKAQKVGENHRKRFQRKMDAIGQRHATRVDAFQTAGAGRLSALEEAQRERKQKLDSDQKAAMRQLEEEWNRFYREVLKSIEEAQAESRQLTPEWSLAFLNQWNPPVAFQNAARFGELEIDLDKFAAALPKNLSLGESRKLHVPLSLVYPKEGSILFEQKSGDDKAAIASLNSILFRLLASAPAGKLSFTIFDPVGLGQGFAGLMHLADYEASNINSRIWTQGAQIEEKLGELNEHMEKVIQMYLRNEYETIAEYNEQAGSIAEKYHFLVVASFPVNFSDTAAKRLRNIAASGARCGVYTLIHWDHRHPLPQDFVPDELRSGSVCLVGTEKGFELSNWREPGCRMLLDEPPSTEVATEFLRKVGEFGKDSNRVEVPFSQIAPAPEQIWSEKTAEELRVPIGRSGATKLQYLAVGRATRQHALIAGKTGSGKSTLFHVIITNLSLWCSPDEVEFYLVDFKKGVEFKCYASRHLPHARVVAIESDRQFGLSVLERVDAELRRRGDLFRKLGVQDVPGYLRAGGTEKMPRSLLMIDEFQEFFVEDDRVSQGAAVLLDRIVRQGRAFGIHVILGSQTLGGAYTLARATLGQMVIRVALQCNEADAYLIMDQDNPAPRLLSRPGEGIYNDTAGSIEGNSPFQAVWLDEAVRDDYLRQIRERANQMPQRYPGPFVFEGNAPAEVAENFPLQQALRSTPERAPLEPRVWLGAPNSIKGPSEIVFRRQSGSHLIIVGQNEESSLAILGTGLLSLSAQFPKNQARFVLVDSMPEGSALRDYLNDVTQSIRQEVVQARTGDVTQLFADLENALKKRSSDGAESDSPTLFVVINNVQNYKKLRQEDEFSFASSESGDSVSPAKVLQALISDGPSHGIHLLLRFDTYNNASRFLGRKALTEFENRVLFQMSASDSAALIDSPDAGTLGLNRALYYNDREGYTETFRPYARPDKGWIEAAAALLQNNHSNTQPV